jgi:hypothetical protein
VSRIIKLESENIQRIKAATFEPAKHRNVIAGKNGNGKTSLISTIFFAIGGKSAISERPVREGEQTALARIETDDLIITRNWTNPETSYLKVQTKAGAKIANAQTYLDSIFGQISFDPMEFVSMDSKSKINTLKKVVGVEKPMDELDQEYEKVFKHRAEVTQEGKRVSAELSQYETVLSELRAVPSVEEIKEQIKIAESQNAKAQEEAFKKKNIGEKIARNVQLHNQYAEDIEIIQKKMLEIEKENQALREIESKMVVEELIDVSSLHLKVEESLKLEMQNKEVARKISLIEKRNALTQSYQDFDSQLKKILNSKKELIENAKMPIDGLSFESDTVFYNGIPFDQLCSAEQIKVSFAMVAAMNFDLRIAVIKNGSLLDDESLEQVFELAEKHDVQVFVETVKSIPDGQCIFISDGEIVHG